MEKLDLTDRILYLNPDAKFSVWDNDKSCYHGEDNPIELSGLLVSWNPANDKECPSQSDIDAIDIDKLNAFIEAKRKSQRNAIMSQQMGIISGYSVAKLANKDLTFSDYLDGLEELQKEIL